MENEHREIIKKILKEPLLLKTIEYDKFMAKCLQTQLLNDAMRKKIEIIDSDLCREMTSEDLKEEKLKRLLKKITHRGPDAFNKLKLLLQDMQNNAVLRLLNETSFEAKGFESINQNKRIFGAPATHTPQENIPIRKVSSSDIIYGDKESSDDVATIKQFAGEIDPHEKYIVIKSKCLCSDPKVPTYQMKLQEKRGVLFLVNNIDFPHPQSRRDGAENDTQSLLHIFQQLDFKLFCYHNLTHDQFQKKLTTLLSSEFVRQTECFALILMSHGTDGKVEFSDGSMVYLRDIQQKFENYECVHLVSKPKILIFPFCLGEIADRGVSEKRLARRSQTDSVVELESPIPRNFPTLSDLIICYASTWGFKTHRDPMLGSWYIQEFCKTVAEHAHDTSFEDMLKRVNGEVSKRRTENDALQTASYQNLGFKKLFFNPGFWEGKNESVND